MFTSIYTDWAAISFTVVMNGLGWDRGRLVLAENLLQRLDGAVDVGLVVEDVRGDADGVVVFLWHASVLYIGVRALRWFEEDVALLQRRDDFTVAAAGE